VRRRGQCALLRWGSPMTAVASRWLLGASIVAGLVVAAACLRASDLARVERAARSPADADVSGGAVSQEEPPTAEKRSTRDPSAEEEWRLEVELRDERGAPVAGRVYLTGLNGDLLDAADTTPPASLVQPVRGTIGLIAYVPGYVPRFFEELTPPPSGVRVLVVSLDHGPGISATVVDESGSPVRARVRACPRGPLPSSSRGATRRARRPPPA
jgi:hypothetical protein